jgi:hypothetical protein
LRLCLVGDALLLVRCVALRSPLPCHPPPPASPTLQFNNSHGALGDRARKLKSEGVLVIRFEMPFNVWCLGCNHLIAKVGAGRWVLVLRDGARRGVWLERP